MDIYSINLTLGGSWITALTERWFLEQWGYDGLLKLPRKHTLMQRKVDNFFVMGPINKSIHSDSRNACQGSSELDFIGDDFITFSTVFSVTVSKFV